MYTDGLNTEQTVLFQQFQEEHFQLFKDWVVRNFFENIENIKLLVTFLQFNEFAAQLQLEEAFRRFFFTVRFTKYLNSTIKFNTIVQDRRRRSYQERNVFVLDKPSNDEGDGTIGEYMLVDTSTPFNMISSPVLFCSALEDATLYEAVGTLTQKQLLVTTLAYGQCYLDTEIAEKLDITQQAVFKTRSAALSKLRKTMGGRSGNQGKEAN
jgi:DNA-directed RNA polymerase specialized sigma24 family protein